MNNNNDDDGVWGRQDHPLRLEQAHAEPSARHPHMTTVLVLQLVQLLLGRKL